MSLLLCLWGFAILIPVRAGHADDPSGRTEQTRIKAFLDGFHAVERLDPPQDISDLAIAGLKGPLPLSGWKGKRVVLNLWATWCPPCVEELPGLDHLKHLQADMGFDVLAVSTDTRMDVARVDYFLKRHGMQYLRTLHDRAGKLENRLSPRPLPITYLVDEKGWAVAVLSGPADWGGRGAQAFIDRWRKDLGLIQMYQTRDKGGKGD